jgi:Salmonella virulence plasmid 65kDa B protein
MRVFASFRQASFAFSRGLMQQSSEKPSKDATPAEKNPYAAPSISLPKGGGAVKGIGEKFGANPVTGTGSLSVPLPASPGRGGFGPSLALSYDSGSGNGVFGFGWGVGLPSITRKTDKGLPLYRDSSESDVFILSGAEDLVPELEGDKPKIKPRDLNGQAYTVHAYRPRIEGLLAFDQQGQHHHVVRQDRELENLRSNRRFENFHLADLREF